MSFSFCKSWSGWCSQVQYRICPQVQVCTRDHAPVLGKSAEHNQSLSVLGKSAPKYSQGWMYLGAVLGDRFCTVLGTTNHSRIYKMKMTLFFGQYKFSVSFGQIILKLGPNELGDNSEPCGCIGSSNMTFFGGVIKKRRRAKSDKSCCITYGKILQYSKDLPIYKILKGFSHNFNSLPYL